jgi:hypothetical protein
MPNECNQSMEINDGSPIGDGWDQCEVCLGLEAGATRLPIWVLSTKIDPSFDINAT